MATCTLCSRPARSGEATCRIHSNASAQEAQKSNTARPHTFGNLADDERCTARNRAGQRCGKKAMSGLTVCRTHGGGAPLAASKSLAERNRRAAERTATARALRPVEADDPEARGDLALGMQIRRAVAWIRYIEDQIAAMGTVIAAHELPREDADILAEALGGVGLVRRDVVSGTERGEQTSLTTEQYASGVGVWEEKLRWWSVHLQGLNKLWIGSGFEAKRLELQGRTLDMLERAIDAIVRDLGHNPRDADVRRVIRDRLVEIEGRTTTDDGMAS